MRYLQSFLILVPGKYPQIRLINSDVIEIISCTDSDGNKWYEVDSLLEILYLKIWKITH